MFGAGDPDPFVPPTEEKPEGTGLGAVPLADPNGAGRVMKPVLSGACEPDFKPAFFLLFVFSVLPFDKGGGSKNSDA